MAYLMPPSPWILSSQSNAFVDFGERILTDAVANELQLGKLQAMLEQLYGHNRFHTAKLKAAGAVPEDIQSLDDLSHLPLTTKNELLETQAADTPLRTERRAHFRVSKATGG